MDLKFEKFRAEHVETLAGYYGKRHDRTCDSTIMDNFLWGGYYHIRFCERDGKAVLWIMNIDGKDYAALPVCSLEDLPHYFKELEQYFNEELQLPLEIFLADEEAVEYLDLPGDRYAVEELPDARDYIYSAESLKVLSGKKLGKKKNHINYLKREYAGRYEYRTLGCSDSLDVWRFLDKWRAQKGQEVEGHLDYEVEGIHEILRNCSAFYVHMGGIYIDGQLEAFAIGSFNETEKMAIIHIEKANPEIRGLYQFINQQFLIHEFPGAEIVNREDDMGLPALRQAKLSYEPSEFARKFRIRQLWPEEGRKQVMIRYLEAEEKGRTRALWNEAFPEDSVSFGDYYYKEKTKDNRILVCEEEGRIVAMLQRNPYAVSMRGDVRTCDYIVGVATAVSERHKGHMRSLLLTMLRDMQEERMPFAFLMPARESLYYPYDFRFIFDQPRWVLGYNKNLRRKPLEGSALYKELADWQNAWLKRQYEVFAVRNPAYLERMEKELRSENGFVNLIYEDDWFIGMESEWGLKEREMRYLYTGERYRALAGTKPAIMARIVCMPEFVKNIRLSEACPEAEIAVEIGIHDLFVPQNQGAWIWKLTKSGSEIVQESRFIAKGKMEVFTIAELTQWLFGYALPEQVKNVPYGQYIEPFRGVFLDEVV